MTTDVAPDFCFIPRDYKVIKIYKPNTYESKSDICFNHVIDCHDKAKIIFIKREPNLASEVTPCEMFKKITQAVKNTWGTTELVYNNFVWDSESNETPRYEFSIYCDLDGNPISEDKLTEFNKKNTVICHTYIFDFYMLCYKTAYDAIVESEKNKIK